MLVAVLPDNPPAPGKTLWHWISDPAITVDGDRATAESFGCTFVAARATPRSYRRSATTRTTSIREGELRWLRRVTRLIPEESLQEKRLTMPHYAHLVLSIACLRRRGDVRRLVRAPRGGDPGDARLRRRSAVLARPGLARAAPRRAPASLALPPRGARWADRRARRSRQLGELECRTGSARSGSAYSGRPLEDRASFPDHSYLVLSHPPRRFNADQYDGWYYAHARRTSPRRASRPCGATS